MKKCLITLVLLMCVISAVWAQEEPLFSQYMINPFSVNPAYSSTEDYIDIQSGYRSQWQQLEGSPKTIFLSGHGTINKPFYKDHYKAEHKNWHGVGFQMLYDQVGPHQKFTALVAYSYNFGVFGKSRLSFGTFLGMKQLRFLSSYWRNIEDATDELFRHDLNTGFQPELQFGMELYEVDNYRFSVSVQNMIMNPINFTSVSDDLTSSRARLNYYLLFEKKLMASEKLSVTPSMMIRSTALQGGVLDVNTKFSYEDAYWLGVSLRNTQAINTFIGFNYDRFLDITFAYEYDFNSLSPFNSGTCEIIVGLRLQHPQVILDPSKFW